MGEGMLAMKEHATYFHWGDWFADESVAQCREATRGIWIDALGRMITAESDRVEGTVDRLVFSLRTCPEILFQAALDLAETGAADVLLDGMPILTWRERRASEGLSEFEFITNSLTKVRLTLISRRLARELESRQLHSKAGKIGMEIRWHKDNEKNNDVITPADNAMVYGDRDMVSGKGGAGGEEQTIYEAYPLKVAKPKALTAIRVAIKKHGFATVLAKTQAYAAARNGDKAFMPHPSTFFNQERYNDDPETWKSREQGTCGHKPSTTGVDRNAGTFNKATGAYSTKRPKDTGANPA